MTVYIKDFKFTESFGKQKICFKYFNGYKWKQLKVDNKFEKENVAVYTRYVFDCIIKDICGKETDVFKRDNLIKKFESDVMCIAQLNLSVLDKSTKIFS